MAERLSHETFSTKTEKRKISHKLAALLLALLAALPLGHQVLRSIEGDGTPPSGDSAHSLSDAEVQLPTITELAGMGDLPPGPSAAGPSDEFIARRRAENAAQNGEIPTLTDLTGIAVPEGSASPGPSQEFIDQRRGE